MVSRPQFWSSQFSLQRKRKTFCKTKLQ